MPLGGYLPPVVGGRGGGGLPDQALDPLLCFLLHSCNIANQEQPPMRPSTAPNEALCPLTLKQQGARGEAGCPTLGSYLLKSG